MALCLALAGLIVFLRWRRKPHQIDLDDGPPTTVTAEMSPSTIPAPFDAYTIYGHSQGTHSDGPISSTDASTPMHPMQDSRPMSPLSSSSHGRKGPAPSASQVVFLRHVDSGRVEAPESEAEESETVELPPLYDPSFRQLNVVNGPGS